MTAIEAIELLQNLIQEQKLIRVIFSEQNKEENTEWKKVIVRPVMIKEQAYMQFEKFKDNKSYHFNMEAASMHEEFSESLKQFKQLQIQSEGRDYQLRKKGNGFKLKKQENDKKATMIAHDRRKNYILEEGEPIDFLVYLGIMSSEGKVLKKSYRKYRQINKYLEFIENTIEEMEEKGYIEDCIRILDFGCGKSYLTFALYYYLHEMKKINCEILGLDLKEDVMKKCAGIAKDLGYENLRFLTGNIKDFEEVPEVDLVFSLHACNNATDYSILKALELKAKAILAVPCCQHEFFHKISQNKKSAFQGELSAMAKHGILTEKFASLATDAYRAAYLEAMGFETQVMEFIDLEHTPKNVLIKAVYQGEPKDLEAKKEECRKITNFLGIKAFLEV